MKKVLAVFLVLMMAGAASAHTAHTAAGLSDTNVSKALQQANFSEYRDEINSQTSELPGFVKTLIGDQRINIYFEDSDLTLGVVMNGVNVAEIKEQSIQNPTLEVWISEGDIEAVANSETPQAELISRLKNKDIRYKVHGAFNQLKFFFVKIFAGF